MRTRLLVAASGAALAVGLALASARVYSAPNLNGSARTSPWLELDFCLALVSCSIAVGVGILAGRGVVRPRVLGAVLMRALSWLGLTLLLAAAWSGPVALLTLLIAPSHAFAGVRLTALARAWRSQRLWSK